MARARGVIDKKTTPPLRMNAVAGEYNVINNGFSRFVGKSQTGKSSCKSLGSTTRHDCSGLSAVILAGNLGRCCPATKLTKHNNFLIIIAFNTACHNTIVLFLHMF